mmetsp:Transcript_996/g.2081  ORF Transcript_996/g.2081 Transcript_996/m.2081 type:complete len:256 (+) Transcript_996:8254-9021(+)
MEANGTVGACGRSVPPFSLHASSPCCHFRVAKSCCHREKPHLQEAQTRGGPPAGSSLRRLAVSGGTHERSACANPGFGAAPRLAQPRHALEARVGPINGTGEAATGPHRSNRVSSRVQCAESLEEDRGAEQAPSSRVRHKNYLLHPPPDAADPGQLPPPPGPVAPSCRTSKTGARRPGTALRLRAGSVLPQVAPRSVRGPEGEPAFPLHAPVAREAPAAPVAPRVFAEPGAKQTRPRGRPRDPSRSAEPNAQSCG